MRHTVWIEVTLDEPTSASYLRLGSLMSLSGIMRHYIKKHRASKQAEIAWFQDQPSLEAAIENAALAIDDRGKKYPHQRRIRLSALPKARLALFEALPCLRSCANFDELLTRVEAVLESITGVNEMYVYDAAFRIGANLGLLPEKVYLHRGTREGARRLGLCFRVRALSPDVLPEPLRELPAHELEDILCIYKDKLAECGGAVSC